MKTFHSRVLFGGLALRVFRIVTIPDGSILIWGERRRSKPVHINPLDIIVAIGSSLEGTRLFAESCTLRRINLLPHTHPAALPSHVRE